MNRISIATLFFHFFGICCALFFAGFGIHVLILCYAMEHPGYFIIFFFTASFIILLSLTLLIALGFRLYQHMQPPVEKFSDDSSDDSEDG